MPLLNPEELESLLTEIVNRLRQAFSPVAVYLHGSYADGTPTRHSDIDLLVVVEDSDLHPYGRDGLAYRQLREVKAPVDVHSTHARNSNSAPFAGLFRKNREAKGRLLNVT